MSSNDLPFDLSSAAESTDASFICDLDMGEPIQDQDYSILDISTPKVNIASPAGETPSNINPSILQHSAHQETLHSHPSVESENLKAKLRNSSERVHKSAQFLLPKAASESPSGSSLDSSSDSSRQHKRKSSSGSSQSPLVGLDVMMTEDADMIDWKVDDVLNTSDATAYNDGFSHSSNLVNPLGLDEDFELSNKAMENDFDFDSAASSPSLFGPRAQHASASAIQPRNFNMPYRSSPKPSNAFQSSSVPNRQFVKPRTTGFPATAGNSREASPLSGVNMSHESSPSALFNNNSSTSPSSSGGGTAKDPVLGSIGSTAWPQTYDFSQQPLPPSTSHTGFTPSPLPNALASPFSPVKPLMESNMPCTMILHPTPYKSRVETQIPIRLSLYPLPPGVTKLHLPTHSISKPKLMVKPTPERSPDTLELQTTVVCTSAMQYPERLQRALARAAGHEPNPLTPPSKVEAQRAASSSGSSASVHSGSSDSGDETRPSNGGDVKICAGCMNRERKRAGRKKVKKPDEEEAWLKDEAKRIIVFNTAEMKEWTPPVKDNASDMIPDRPIPGIPDGAMQIDAPMRIACYCRHQSEKVGFQVIFTIRDWQDHVIAQSISTSIMITDDHKTTPAGPTLATSNSNSDMENIRGHHGLQAVSFASERDANAQMSASTTPVRAQSPFRLSHSHSDLQSLQQHSHFMPTVGVSSSSFMGPRHGHSASASQTPKTLSRQASHSGPSGPSHKKRKSSGPPRVPTDLAMTRIETSSPQNGYMLASAGPSSANQSTAPSPFTPSYNMPPAELSYISPPTSMPSHVATGPPTPLNNEYGFFTQAQRSQSMENLQLHPLFSAPSSAHPSRPPSPSDRQRRIFQPNPAQMAQAVTNGLYGVPLAVNPHRPPTIHKLIPHEGPLTGGIEITCLGSGFVQGLEVMFGDSLATTTTFWNEALLVCLLPPGPCSGPVTVTFKHQHQHQQQQQQQQHQQRMQQYQGSANIKSSIVFTYIDDEVNQLLRLALSVVGHKMTGRVEDVADVARRIVGAAHDPQNWGSNAPNGGSSGGSGQQNRSHTSSLFGSMDPETILLRALDLIDLDDSFHSARWNMRTISGQTMLHFACSLGLHRFVAGLLARGANPDPRDKGGFSPLHFASLRNHPQVVRKLILNGADPTMRSLLGFTAADLAASEYVLLARRRIQSHARPRRGILRSAHDESAGAISLKSIWNSANSTLQMSAELDSRDDEVTSSLEDADHVTERPAEQAFWIGSRRPSLIKKNSAQAAILQDRASNAETVLSPTNTSASMALWRTSISAQLQSLQQTVQGNLPTLPPMPNLPDYQTYITQPVRRISSLVPNRSSPRPVSPKEMLSKEADYKWWELFSTSAPPPAYSEIYPSNEEYERYSSNDKKVTAAVMAADTIADQACSKAFDTREVSSTKLPETIDLRLGRQGSLTLEQCEQLRIAHARKIKRIRSDRNLFFIWIPLLIIIVVMMLKNGLPEIWQTAREIYTLTKRRYEERIVEV